MGHRPKIVVLTPVKNEAWMLDRFLATTRRFADAVLIVDQQSTDASREIAARYDNVVWIDSPSRAYDEAARQRLLIDEARRRWPPPTILLALDADEILAANGQASSDWGKMLDAPPGTVLLFEKPDLLPGLDRCFRYPSNPVALGFVDDGTSPHHPLHIHSPRLPQPADAPRLVLDGIKILHYGLTRVKAQMAKLRFYAVQENLARTSPLHRRRAWYAHYQRQSTRMARAAVAPEAAWFEGWTRLGISLDHVGDEPLCWQALDVLRAFAEHGERRFWIDPLWDCDWEALRLEALRHGVAGLPARPIAGPPFGHRAFGVAIDVAVALARSPLVAGPKSFMRSIAANGRAVG